MFHKLLNLMGRIRRAFRRPYYGFVCGHAYLDSKELGRIGSMVGIRDDSVVTNYEKQFAQLIGPGEAIAYAAARMGFYELLQILNIGKGNEVILLGATCSVMVNAVMRTGATPIYADIDPDTFGSSCAAIELCITPRTRMIVAQHSFGIPCEIESIINLALAKKIFLLEDCALTLGSQVKGKIVGNFGDAALFSTDHSKPLNTLIGGIIYTNNAGLAKKLRISQAQCQELSIERQQALWRRLLLEARYCSPEQYGKMGIFELTLSIRKKITQGEDDLLANDSGPGHESSYPYPAKLPTYLAAIGLIEIQRWPAVSLERKNNLKFFLSALANSKSADYIAAAYLNSSLEIVPLRFVWSEPNGPILRCLFNSFVDTSWTWFMAPIIATKHKLESLAYYSGMCPISERIGPNMINFPCVHNEEDTKKLITYFMNKCKN